MCKPEKFVSHEFVKLYHKSNVLALYTFFGRDHAPLIGKDSVNCMQFQTVYVTFAHDFSPGNSEGSYLYFCFI